MSSTLFDPGPNCGIFGNLSFRYLNMSLTAGSGVRKQDGSGVHNTTHIHYLLMGNYRISEVLDISSFLFFNICLILGLQVIGSVARNTVGRYLAFDFIRDKWSIVKD